MVDQLKFIIPVCDYWIMVIEVVRIIIEVCKWFAVISDDALAAMKIRRAVIADNIKHNPNAPLMKGIDYAMQCGAGPQ
jgi:hypothetical protein